MKAASAEPVSTFTTGRLAAGTRHGLDDSGTLLQLNGSLVDGVMVLSGQRPARDGGGMAQHRISWTPNPDGSVRQLWEASKDEGRLWTVLFDGLYTKEPASQ